MNWWGKALSCLAFVCLSAASVCIPFNTGWPIAVPGGEPSNLDLMATAEEMVAPDYPNAILIEVLGAASGGHGSVAGDVDRWQFRFTEDPNAAGAGTVWVDYDNGVFAGPYYTSQGLIGTVFKVLPRTMDLATAIQKMRDAGFADSFSGVTFREPLTFPPPGEALYAFSLPDRYVLVGAITGNVSDETAFLSP